MANANQVRIGQQCVQIRTHSAIEIWNPLPRNLPPAANVAESADAALRAPEDYPPIEDALVDDDSLAISADANIPHLPEVMAGVMRAIPLGRLRRVSVLLSESAGEPLVQAIRQVVGDRADVLVHDPDDREALGYLAATEQAEPIYLNRALLEADFVLPISVARPPGTLDPSTASGGIFPAMADRAAQQRLRRRQLGSPHTAASEAASEAASDEPDQVAWLLGIQLLLQIVPAGGEEIALVRAGSAGGLSRALDHLVESAWRRGPVARAEVVVACVDGDAQQQNWENVARALYVAEQLVAPGGTVAVCSELSDAPGTSLRRLRTTEEPERLRARIDRDLSPDATAAALLLRGRTEGRVLMWSHLPREEVEDLGIGVLEGPEDLARLIDQHASCLILRSAQYCAPGPIT